MCDFYFVYFLLRFLLFHICPLSRTYPVITCCHPKGILSFGTLFSFSFCALLLTLHSCLEASATALYFRLVDGRIRINMSPPSNILWLVAAFNRVDIPKSGELGLPSIFAICHIDCSVYLAIFHRFFIPRCGPFERIGNGTRSTGAQCANTNAHPTDRFLSGKQFSLGDFLRASRDLLR